MSLTAEEIKKIAVLAHLSMSAEQLEDNVIELNNIIGLVDQLSAIDTDDIEPMAHPLNMTQRLREDEVLEKNHVQDFQSCAPKVVDGYYLVPRVIE